MVYTFNPSMEGKDRWNPEFQKLCLQKAKQKQTNKWTTNHPQPPKKPFAQMFLKPTSSLLPTYELQRFGILNHNRQAEGGWSPLTVSMVGSWKWLFSVTAHAY